MENFAEIAARFVAADAAIQVESPEDAGVAWIELLRNPERRQKMGENAKHLVDTSRGATDRAGRQMILGDDLSQSTRTAIANAAIPAPLRTGLLLGSPEFQRR